MLCVILLGYLVSQNIVAVPTGMHVFRTGDGVAHQVMTEWSLHRMASVSHQLQIIVAGCHVPFAQSSADEV